MVKPVRIHISSAGHGTDAPAVDDLLQQLDDVAAILREVEKALAEDGTNAIEWRVTDVSKNSPLAVEITPFAREHALNIDRRERLVREYAARGLDTLKKTTDRPAFFSKPVLDHAEKLFRRVTNGLAGTSIDFGDTDLPILDVDPKVARQAVEHISAVRQPKGRPYRELGSVEGYLRRVERDGRGKPLLWIKVRLTGDEVKCVAGGRALSELERQEIGLVWKSRRVRVYGTIHYKGIGRIDWIAAEAVTFVPGEDELPSPDDIVDRQFTNDVRTEDYLERLRNGGLS